MKNLHLYSREGKCNLHSLNKSAFNRVISKKVSELTDSCKKFCNLEISKIESIDKGSIREFSYTYHGFISYIPPDTGYPDYVYDLRRGFIWIPYKDLWSCICAKDEKVAKVLHESIKEYFGFKSKALQLQLDRLNCSLNKMIKEQINPMQRKINDLIRKKKQKETMQKNIKKLVKQLPVLKQRILGMTQKEVDFAMKRKDIVELNTLLRAAQQKKVQQKKKLMAALKKIRKQEKKLEKIKF